MKLKHPKLDSTSYVVGNGRRYKSDHIIKNDKPR